jgi:diguanylate cyclase (GGDEF)-like protein/PAS domain S-box-containing protein
MKDQSKTKQMLIQELYLFRQKIAELEQSELDRKQVEEKLQESEKYFKEITENASDIIIITDKNGAIKYCSRSVERFTGYKPEELIGRNALKLIHPDDVKRAVADLGKAILSIDSAIPNAFRIVHKDGSERYFEGLGRNLLDNPAVAGFIMNVRDMTERKRVEEDLRESEEKYRNIIENIEDGYFEVDLAGNFTFFNPSLCRILGYPREEMPGMNNRVYMDAENAKKCFRAYNGVYVTGIPQRGFEWEIIRKDGARTYLEVSVSLIVRPGEKPTGFRGIARDITERNRVEEALRESENRYRELSIIDDLTQLYNSRHFYQQLRMEIDRVDRYGHPLTILLLDLDDFKVFNDAYGHIEGDQVLIRLGQVVKRCLRQTDSAYRYGGEEFTILLPMTTSADGAVTAERIRTEFKKELFSPAPGQDVHLTLSLGLAQYKPQEDMKVFVHRVDQLMYQGKKNGKDRVCCES